MSEFDEAPVEAPVEAPAIEAAPAVPAEVPPAELSFPTNWGQVISEIKVVAADASNVLAFVSKLPLPAQFSVPLGVVEGLLKFVQKL